MSKGEFKNIDKIYSRYRIKLPQFKNKRFVHLDKKYYFILIWVITIITVVYMINLLEPLFEQLCVEKAKEIATRIINIESSEVLKDVNYNDLILVEKDSNDKIKMVKSNVVLINLLASDIAYNIQDKLSAVEEATIGMRLGALTGSRFLAGVGPNISIQIIPAGNVETVFSSRFEAAGVNQTIHRLYLIIDCEVNILTSYNIINTKIKNEVLFAENIIIGDVPATYYNLEGLESRDSIEVLN